MSLLNSEKIVFQYESPAEGIHDSKHAPSPTIFSHKLIFRGNQFENGNHTENFGSRLPTREAMIRRATTAALLLATVACGESTEAPSSTQAPTAPASENKHCIDANTPPFNGGPDPDLQDKNFIPSCGKNNDGATESGAAGYSPVQYVHADLIKLIKQMIAEKEEVPGDVYGALIRLVFHDAGTYDKNRGTGGAHGCIAVPCTGVNKCEYTSDNNLGLPYMIDELRKLYDSRNYYDVLSFADFMHFAGYLAVKLSAPAYTDELEFKWGRTDCPHQMPYFGNMPSAEEQSFDYYWSFFDAMGLSPTDMIALLGAHTVGRLDRSNMGYEGPWVYQPAVFDNEYYKILHDPKFKWHRTSLPNRYFGTRHFFTSGKDSPIQHRTMLCADMSMFWDIADGQCEIHTSGYQMTPYGVMPRRECGKTKWWPLLELYAKDNYAWMHDFNIAFMKLQNLGLGKPYGHGEGPPSNKNYDGYGGMGYGNYASWGEYGGEHASWGPQYSTPAPGQYGFQSKTGDLSYSKAPGYAAQSSGRSRSRYATSGYSSAGYSQQQQSSYEQTTQQPSQQAQQQSSGAYQQQSSEGSYKQQQTSRYKPQSSYAQNQLYGWGSYYAMPMYFKPSKKLKYSWGPPPVYSGGYFALYPDEYEAGASDDEANEDEYDAEYQPDYAVQAGVADLLERVGNGGERVVDGEGVASKPFLIVVAVTEGQVINE
eukprot:g3733.t1